MGVAVVPAPRSPHARVRRGSLLASLNPDDAAESFQSKAMRFRRGWTVEGGYGRDVLRGAVGNVSQSGGSGFRVWIATPKTRRRPRMTPT